MEFDGGRGPGVLIPILKGGLGNQLFIYATAKAIAAERGLELRIDVESGFSKDFKYRRSFSLRGLNLDVSYASKGECLGRPLDWKRRYLKNIANPLSLGNAVLVEESNPGFDPNLLEKVPRFGRVYLDGYFQSEKYFEHLRSDLYSEFGFRDENELHARCVSVIGDPSRSTCIHVRLFNDQEDERDRLKAYYSNAIDRLRAMGKADRIFVVCEDAGMAKEVLDPALRNVHFVDSQGRSELEDFYILSACRNIVIAESTFSWWAAWIGEKNYDDRIVIAPRHRKTCGVSSWGFQGLIPDRWLSL